MLVNDNPSFLRLMFNDFSTSSTSEFHMPLKLGVRLEICGVFLRWVDLIVAIYDYDIDTRKRRLGPTETGDDAGLGNILRAEVS